MRINHRRGVENSITDIKTGVSNFTPGGVQRKPAYRLVGVRHIGGANLVRALMWNVGTCRPDVKGGTQAEDPQGSEYRCRAQGRNNS